MDESPPSQSQRVVEIASREQRSSKMLVILDTGEQRVITFTLPRKSCTVMELLETVNIRVDRDSDIECIANPGGKIDYIVKVGQNKTDYAAMAKAAENAMRQRQMQQQQQIQIQQTAQQTQQRWFQTHSNVQARKRRTNINTVSWTRQTAADKTKDIPKPPEPKYYTGYMAVCAACGATGSDHAKCERCHRVFNETPKSIKITHETTTPLMALCTVCGATGFHHIICERCHRILN